MKRLQLSQGKFTVVDDDIFEIEKHRKWCATKDRNIWYAVRGSWLGKKYQKHRLHHCIIGRPLKGFEVDHIDGDGLNNQRSNLRIVTISANQLNVNNYKYGKDAGVYFQRGRWIARVTPMGRTIHLGTFKFKDQASDVYRIAKKVAIALSKPPE